MIDEGVREPKGSGLKFEEGRPRVKNRGTEPGEAWPLVERCAMNDERRAEGRGRP